MEIIGNFRVCSVQIKQKTREEQKKDETVLNCRTKNKIKQEKIKVRMNKLTELQSLKFSPKYSGMNMKLW